MALFSSIVLWLAQLSSGHPIHVSAAFQKALTPHSAMIQLSLPEFETMQRSQAADLNSAIHEFQQRHSFINREIMDTQLRTSNRRWMSYAWAGSSAVTTLHHIRILQNI
jgi:hypothetical protein